jgi:pyruvate/2-oxoglutarate/acetoin dehydrogenase E1 component
MKEISYAEALREALREEMKRDERVIVIGEEVGIYGGVYKVTEGLLKEFGKDRVIDTPISESAIIGLASGAALVGLRPIAEIMFMDFLLVCLDQIVTQAAKMRFMSGGQLKVPIVIRTQYSLGRVHAAQHSQFLASWFYQVPGLLVALPSTPYDAKGLLKEAIRNDNPVLFVESGVLYRTKGKVPEKEYTIQFGKADIKKKGDDLTLVAISRCLPLSLEAASELEEEGISCEVIDPRTIVPLDFEAIMNSVKRTNRLMIVEDSVKTGGIGAEIAARVAEEGLEYLDAPIVRVNSYDMPVPFSPSLELQYMPSKERVIEEVKRLLGR